MFHPGIALSMRRATIVTLMAFLALSQPANADVVVYGIHTETGSDVVVDIRSDITALRLLTFGVKLGYDPAVLEVQAATKNENDWFLGQDKHPYVDPDMALAGEVLIWGARFDPLDPFGGVEGRSVQLVEVSFTRLASGDPHLTLDFAGAGDQQNFVTTTGASIDATEVSFLPEPAAGSMLVSGLGLLAALARRRGHAPSH